MDLSNQASAALVGAEKLRSIVERAIMLGPKSPASQTYQVKSRVKSVASIVEKVEGKRSSNKPEYKVSDIRDIVGFRFLTLFQQDLISLIKGFVDFIARFQSAPVELFYGENLINCVEEVIVYKSNTNEEAYDTIFQFLKGYFIARGFDENFVKLETKDTKYSSVHIVSLGQVHEENEIITIPIEFQLRTVFEDVWSEIEHKLIYKNPILSLDSDGETRKTIGRKQLKTLKDFMDSCSQVADDAFFYLKSEDKSESISSFSNAAPSNLATIFIGLKEVLPADSYKEFDNALQNITAAYKKLIELKGKYKDSNLSLDFTKVISELSSLDSRWRENMSKNPSNFGKYVYCIDMEIAAAKVWLGQLIRVERSDGQDNPSGELILKESRDLFEEGMQIYLGISIYPQYANDPVLNFRAGGVYRLLGQFEFAIAYYEAAISGMDDPNWKDRGTVFEVLIPRHLGYILWRQAELWRRSNPRISSAAISEGGSSSRACYALVISFSACLSMRQTKATMCRPANVLA